MAKDLRLLLPTLALWAGTATVFWIEARVWWPLIVVLAGLVVACRRGLLRIAVVLCIAGVVSSVIRVLPLVHELPKEHFDSVFVVEADPSQRNTVGSVEFGSRQSVRIDVVLANGNEVHIPAMLTNTSPTLQGIGSQWSCRMSVTSTHVLYRFSAFARCHSPPLLRVSSPRFQQWADHVRDALARVTYLRAPRDDAAALLPALVEGDTRGQSPALSRTMNQAGLGHLTAVSGANVAILFGVLNLVLRKTRLRPGMRIAVQLAALMAFVVLARPTASVVRAAVMAAAGLGYWFFGRRRYAEVVLLVSVFLLLVIDPWLSVSWGFGLSVAATFGLIVLPQHFGAGGRVSHMLMTAFAATIATTPLLIAMGAQPTFATIPANVLSEVFVAPATIIGFLTLIFAVLAGLTVVGPLFLSLSLITGWFAIKCAAAVLWIAKYVNETSLSLHVVSWQGVAALFVAFLVFRRAHHHRVLWGMSAMLVFVVLSTQTMQVLRPWPLREWNVVACDVGQGDATVLKTGAHSAVVVDAGGDAELVDSCLRKLNIDHIELFVVSHFHADHVGGFAGVIKDRRVDALLIPPQDQPHMGFAIVATSAIPREFARVGDVRRFGNVTLQVLQVGPPIANPDDGTDINNSSLVLLVTINNRRILLTGDIEETAQVALMHSVSALHVDMVKIAHHGSRYQSSDFAHFVRPAIAWASVGADNPYRHPSLETLNSYRNESAQVLTTMDCGSIAFALGEVLQWAGSRPCHA
ncbi:MAG: hypothetical protein RL410_356 [Actinomycetota bacterium]